MKISFYLIIALLLAGTCLKGQSKDTTGLFKEKKLGEVVVKSRKPFIEMQADKLVLNVESDIIAAGGNLLDILQKAPGVSITNEENISMSAKKGVNVLIDGRLIQLSGKDLINYLKSLPASMADKIEIISNPSSKYDAQGNAGIINIRLKKNIAKGTNGNISTSYTKSDHYRSNISVNLNHRQGKWNWFANAGGGKDLQHTRGSLLRDVSTGGSHTFFNNRTTDKDGSHTFNYQLGADLYLNKKNTFGAIIKASDYNNPMLTPGVTLIGNNNRVDSSLRTLNDNKMSNRRYNYNLNYKFEDTLGNSLNIDADHTFYRNSSYGFVTTDLLDAQEMKYGYTADDQDAATSINIYSIKSDYSRTIKKLKIESGLKWNIIETNNDLRAYRFQNNSMQVDTGRTNKFNYKETMYAGYIMLSGEKRNWEYQLGLRGEHSIINGQSTDLKNKKINYPDTSYFNLFPSLFLRYKTNENNSFAFSYTRRINRPSYQSLNPFEYIYDNYSTERGNPYLLPEFTHTIELSWAWHNIINMATGFSHTTNFIQSISSIREQVITESEFNLGEENRLYANISINIPVAKWWQSYTSISPFYKKYKGAIPVGVAGKTASGMSWYFTQSFILPQKWKFQLSSWGNLATRDALYQTAWLGSLDAGVSRLLLKDKLNLRLSMIDIFNTQRWQQDAQFASFSFHYTRKWESRGLRLQVSWKFGKTNYKLRERSAGTEEETKRIK